MKKILISLASLLLASQAFGNAVITGGNSNYLCSYQARISDNDKFNSSGDLIATAYNKASVAAIIRQDRANFHKFYVRDPQDTSDCVFHSKSNRALLERWLANGQVNPMNIRRIVDGNPLIRVDVYRNSISVEVL